VESTDKTEGVVSKVIQVFLEKTGRTEPKVVQVSKVKGDPKGIVALSGPRVREVPLEETAPTETMALKETKERPVIQEKTDHVAMLD